MAKYKTFYWEPAEKNNQNPPFSNKQLMYNCLIATSSGL